MSIPTSIPVKTNWLDKHKYIIGIIITSFILLIVIILIVIFMPKEKPIKIDETKWIKHKKNPYENELINILQLAGTKFVIIDSKSTFIDNVKIDNQVKILMNNHIKHGEIINKTGMLRVAQSPLEMQNTNITVDHIDHFNWLCLNTDKLGDPNKILKKHLTGAQIIGSFKSPPGPEIYFQDKCGQCWALAISTCLSDKFSLATNLSNPHLDPTSILSCCCKNSIYQKLSFLSKTNTFTNCGCNKVNNIDFTKNCCGEPQTAGRCQGGTLQAAAWSAAIIGLTTIDCWNSNANNAKWYVKGDSTSPANIPSCVYPLSNMKCFNGKNSKEMDTKYGIGVYYAEKKAHPKYCGLSYGNNTSCKGVSLIADPNVINRPYNNTEMNTTTKGIKNEVLLFGPVPTTILCTREYLESFSGGSRDLNLDSTDGIYLPFYEKNKKWVKSYNIKEPCSVTGDICTIVIPVDGQHSFNVYTNKDTNIDSSYSAYQFIGGHAISICGWGKSSLTEINGDKLQWPVYYWIVRNSWGLDKTSNSTVNMENIPKGCYKVAMYPYFNWGYDIPIFCKSISSTIVSDDFTKNTLICGGIQVRASDTTINQMLKIKHKPRNSPIHPKQEKEPSNLDLIIGLSSGLSLIVIINIVLLVIIFSKK